MKGGYFHEDVCKCLQLLIRDVRGKSEIDQLPQINPFPDPPDLQIVLRGVGVDGHPYMKSPSFSLHPWEFSPLFPVPGNDFKRLRERLRARHNLPLHPVAEQGRVNVRWEVIDVNPVTQPGLVGVVKLLSGHNRDRSPGPVDHQQDLVLPAIITKLHQCRGMLVGLNVDHEPPTTHFLTSSRPWIAKSRSRSRTRS